MRKSITIDLGFQVRKITYKSQKQAIKEWRELHTVTKHNFAIRGVKVRLAR